MSTRNFYVENASRIFVIDCHSDFDYQDSMFIITEELSSKGWGPASECTNDRMYSGHIFATKSIKVAIGRCCVDVTVRAIVRSGYYQDANVDWDLLIDGESYYPDDIDVDAARDILEADYWYGDNIGFCKIQAKPLFRRLQAAIQAMTEELEEVYANLTNSYITVGVYSNGATIYAPYTSRTRLISAANGLAC